MIQQVNTAIDAVQGVKTSFVNTFVTNEEFKKPLQTFINAQTTFAKKVAAEANTFFTTIGYSASLFDLKKAFATK